MLGVIFQHLHSLSVISVLFFTVRTRTSKHTYHTQEQLEDSLICTVDGNVHGSDVTLCFHTCGAKLNTDRSHGVCVCVCVENTCEKYIYDLQLKWSDSEIN